MCVLLFCAPCLPHPIFTNICVCASFFFFYSCLVLHHSTIRVHHVH